MREGRGCELWPACRMVCRRCPNLVCHRCAAHRRVCGQCSSAWTAHSRALGACTHCTQRAEWVGVQCFQPETGSCAKQQQPISRRVGVQGQHCCDRVGGLGVCCCCQVESLLRSSLNCVWVRAHSCTGPDQPTLSAVPCCAVHVRQLGESGVAGTDRQSAGELHATMRGCVC
jgi:hypothetical protein